MSTFVYYFVPEDNENETKMNLFIVYKDYKELRLKDIKDSFPLPGEYHFRFKFEFQEKSVWIDFNNPNAVLPRYNGKIIMKVSRLSWGNTSPNNNECQVTSEQDKKSIENIFG